MPAISATKEKFIFWKLREKIMETFIYKYNDGTEFKERESDWEVEDKDNQR